MSASPQPLGWAPTWAVCVALLSPLNASAQAPCTGDSSATESCVRLADAVEIHAGGDRCLGDDLTASIARWLGRDAVDRRLAISLRVVHGERAQMRLTRNGEVVAERMFASLPERCAERRAALSLAMALAIDAAWVEPEPRDEPPRLSMRAGGGALIGLLGEPAVFGAVSLGIELAPAFELELGALGTSLVGGSLGEGRSEAQLVGGRFGVCGGGRLRPLTVQACLSGWLGAVHAAGQGFDEDRAQWLGWGAVAAGARLSLSPVDWMAVEAFADGLITYWRPRFEVRDDAGGLRSESSLPLAGVALGVQLAFFVIP